MTDQRLTANLNKNITDAMFEFQKKTVDEKDYTAVALGIHYMLISIYKSTNDPKWKDRLLGHVKELLEEVQ